MSLNDELSTLFARFAALMELKGESTFKAIAFQKVSRVLHDLPFDIRSAALAGTLDDIEGVGASSRKIIADYVKTGRSADYDDVAATVPPGLVELLSINGLGPKTAALFWRERGITSLAELKAALANGTLDGLKGVGTKKLDQIRQGIDLLERSAGRLGIADAAAIGTPLLAAVRGMPDVDRAELAGSLRRRRETVGDIDIVCALRPGRDAHGPAVTAAFATLPGVTRVLGQGETKASVLIGNTQADLRIVPLASFGAALMYFTGSKDHNVRVRGLAQDRGLTLNEWGLYDEAAYAKAPKETGHAPKLKSLAGASEADIYTALGLAYVEPELREDRGEVALAATNALPNLITAADLRGDLHSHTTASDGTGSIEEMAEAAKALGYAYLAITDHSKSQTIAHGLDETRLLAHVAAIRKAQSRLKGITLLAGCEVDILVDGRLDFEGAILAELDWVVASPHVSLRQDTEKATARILRAIDNPYVNVIGHPTGRLLNQREGLPLDFAPIFKAAADSGTALEINAGYPRLDLNDVAARGAAAAGCMLTVDTDAHSPAGLSEIGFGLDMARRAGLTAGQVVNCWPLAKVQSWVTAKRP